MSNNKLIKLITELKTELESSTNLTDSDKTSLANIISEVDNFINNGSSKTEIYSSLDKIEASHPLIVNILKRIMDALCNMGV